MSITKSRINVSLSDEIKSAISQLAERDHIPVATKAARLLELALELEEDAEWNTIAEKRDHKGVRFISHAKAWK